MADEPVPDDVRDYILNHIDSIVQLEALMLLRAHPAECWDAAKMARRLYVSEPDVSNAVGRLVNDGVVNLEQDTFTYRPSPDIQALIDRVAATYRRHLIPVTNLIHTKPSRISQFADAFKFRRDR
jgi:DNA-binding MarR family transcriptional regulator